MTENWRPCADITTLKKRAVIIKKIRAFFDKREYLEVETPIMSHFGVTEPYLENMTTTFREKKLYLQTSPEYHMKRLLAAGCGSIYQIIKAFRDDESGLYHNPEFSMLEWYKLNANHFELIDEIDKFLQIILNCKPLEKISYKKAFLKYCNLNPLEKNYNKLLKILQKTIVDFNIAVNSDFFTNTSDPDDNINQYLFLLMSHVIEPKLKIKNHPVAVYDFPSSQASLAIVHNGIAQRFEIFYKGLELANGFHELIDYKEQEQRFYKNNLLRNIKFNKTMEIDKRFLQALASGLPECSGVALGIDRLIMLALNKKSLSEVVSFNYDNA